MKNKSISIIAILILLAFGFGCSYIDQVREMSNSNSNKTLTEKGVDGVTGEKKIGVKECDDFMDELEQSNKKKDDDFLSEGARRVFVNELRDKMRRASKKTKKTQPNKRKNASNIKSNTTNI